MTPRQQRRHLRIWLVLGPALLAGLVVLTALRPGPPVTVAEEGAP